MNALTRVAESHVLHAQFAGPIVMIGFGSIGRGVLPLLERHIGFDRALGYGLKYANGFGFTHLGRIGKPSN